MVWKQDLAKLKQAFRETGGPPPPPVKPKPKPHEVKALDDEDAFFLAAMGTPAPRPAPLQPTASAVPAVRVAVPPVVEPSFEAELQDLKGIKPLGRNPVLAPVPVMIPAVVEPPPVLPEPLLNVTHLPMEALPSPVGDSESHPSKAPLRIQLAAGMAVEVDATLDLRNHSVPDALGRLRDRLEDGALMGWRTLHVVLGEDEALHASVVAFFSEGGASRISRYAQAPIPMGGTQAWVLYY